MSQRNRRILVASGVMFVVSATLSVWVLARTSTDSETWLLSLSISLISAAGFAVMLGDPVPGERMSGALSIVLSGAVAVAANVAMFISAAWVSLGVAAAGTTAVFAMVVYYHRNPMPADKRNH